ncbi:MAG TPA: hypothetical protein VF791_05875 [Pyrinomonadaceae bacterium]
MTEDLLYIAVAVLVPLIPAYILYRTLPAQASLGGPFKGLNLQLSGAFAGYFVLVLVVFGFVYSRPRQCPAVTPCPPPDVLKSTVYNVEGQIAVGGQMNVKEIALSLQPPERTVESNGHFAFDIPVKPGQAGESEYLSLLINYPEYEQETIDLREKPPSFFKQLYHIHYDKNARKIYIEEPIILRKKEAAPPYSPSKSQKPQTAPPSEETTP